VGQERGGAGGCARARRSGRQRGLARGVAGAGENLRHLLREREEEVRRQRRTSTPRNPSPQAMASTCPGGPQQPWRGAARPAERGGAAS
jgi:hypothetical protein